MNAKIVNFKHNEIKQFFFITRSFDTMFLLTASEVILGTAIIMGLSAVVTILLRICSRPRHGRSLRNNRNVPDQLGRTGIRVSLTSLQQRVMSKLRDRPPRYETRHNYEYQRRETSTRIAVLNPAASISVANIPPPAYENGSDNNSVRFIDYLVMILKRKTAVLGTFVTVFYWKQLKVARIVENSFWSSFQLFFGGRLHF